jgi:hypothetical protein
LGNNDATDPNVSAQLGDTPGSLGIGDHAEVIAYASPVQHRWGRVSSKTKRRSSSKASLRRPKKEKPKESGGELNIFGDFRPGPWKSDAEILEALKNDDEWFPGTAELKKFAQSGRGHVAGAVNVWNVLREIAKSHPHRVNIFTHAIAGYIGLSGRVVSGNVYFDTRSEANELNEDLIALAEDEDFSFSVGKDKHGMGEVREALGTGGEVVIYACHAGLDRRYLQKLAKVLKATVKGFSEEIRYHPKKTHDGKRILGWEFSAGDSPKVSDFHALIPDIVVTPQEL